MGQLTNQYVSQSYQGLLKLDDSTTGVTGTLQYVQDGVGNNLPIQVSTSSVVISGSFYGDGSGLTGLTIDSGSLVTTASFNAYTSSNDTKVNDLISQTGSYVTESESGSFVISVLTGLTSDRIEVTKGDGSQNTIIIDNVQSSSFAQNALSASYAPDTTNTGSLVSDVSLLSPTNDTILVTKGDGTNSQFTIDNVQSSSFATNALSASYAPTVLPSGVVSGSQQIVDLGFATTSSLDTLSGSIATTDFNQDSRLTALEGVTGSINRDGLITTGSIASPTQSITGSLNVSGEITALSASITYLETIYQTSSVIFTSGSNILGDEPSDVQTLNGRVDIPLGDLNVTGATTSSLGFFGDLQGTASYASNALSSSHSINSDTASYVLNAVSSSYSDFALSSSFAQNAISASHSVNSDISISSSFAQNAISSSHSINSDSSISSSFAQNAISASHSVNSDNSISSSFSQVAISSSWSDNALSSSHSEYSDDSGLLNGTGSGVFATTGSNTFIGNQTITGSLFMSGSASYDIDVYGRIKIGGPSTGNTPRLLISSSAGTGFIDYNNLQFVKTGDLSFQANTAFGGFMGLADLTDSTEIALGLDGAQSSGNWTKGPVLYVNNDPADSYNAVFGFQNKTNYTDGRITLLKNTDISGSLNVTNGITGSLEGTASYATNALSSSHSINADTASFFNGLIESASYAVNADTASYVLNAVSSSYSDFTLSSSYADNATSSSYSVNSDTSISSSFSQYAISSSYADVAGSAGSSDSALRTTITAKNVSGSPIPKGTPCYITGSGTSGNIVGVWPADAGDPTRMPAGVILNASLNAGDEGEAIVVGYINGVDTSAFASGDSVYVAVGGGYTNVKPTGSALIQKLGNVEKSDINGSGVITGPGRSNDVPNIQTGYFWVGNDDQVATPVSTGSFATTGSNTFIGNQTITGSVNISGSLDVLGSTTLNTITPNDFKQNSILIASKNAVSSSTIFENYLSRITSSLDNDDVNFIMAPGGGMPPTGLNGFAGSIQISGSNNILLNAGNAQPISSGRKQYLGSYNIGSFIPTLNTSSLVLPNVNNNYFATSPTLNYTTGSNIGNGAHTMISNLLLSTTNLNHVSASVGSGQSSTFQSNINVGSFSSNLTGQTLTSVHSILNNINAGTATLNAISSSINYQNNITAVGGTGFVINNNFNNTGSNNLLAVVGNVVAGQGVNVLTQGSPLTNSSRTLVGSFLGGQSVNIHLGGTGVDLAGLRNSIVAGYNLNVSGSHAASNTTQQGTAFFGRWNSEDNGLADSARTVFAVGTGNASGNRKTGFYITSGSLVGISGSLDVIGNSTMTGSVQGNVSDITVSSQTGSIDLNNGNFFVIPLGNASSDVRLEFSNVKPGQTVNLKLVTDTSNTVSFGGNVLQPSGSAYTPTATSGSVDILTLVSFDSTDLYVANVKNLI